MNRRNVSEFEDSHTSPDYKFFLSTEISLENTHLMSGSGEGPPTIWELQSMSFFKQ